MNAPESRACARLPQQREAVAWAVIVLSLAILGVVLFGGGL